jgi:hypothetical protein
MHQGARQMKISELGRYALSVSIAAAMLAGCGGSQPPIGASNGYRSSTGLKPASTGVLWVNSGHCGTGPFTGICLYSFPEGKYLGWVEYYAGSYPNNLCSDRQGNIYAPSEFGSYAEVLEYNGPSSVLSDGSNSPDGCAVDPTSGDLAVANTGYNNPGNVAIFADAHGDPKYYRAPNLFDYHFCTYDDRGNLYVSGANKSGLPGIAELARGTKKFVAVTVNKKIRSVGPIQWDGRDFALGYGDLYGDVIYRVVFSGLKGKVVGTTDLKNPSKGHKRIRPFWIQGDLIIASYLESEGVPIGIWNYRAGGTPIKIIRHGGHGEVREFRMLTVSATPAP